MFGRLLASALPWRCFPAARRQLQHPRPTARPSVPPFAKNISQTLKTLKPAKDGTATWLVVTNAHRVEVEVGADGHASAPHSGAAAIAPPAGATPRIGQVVYKLLLPSLPIVIKYCGIAGLDT
jgi:hypothetical protein